jgi:hypothetical protein
MIPSKGIATDFLRCASRLGCCADTEEDEKDDDNEDAERLGSE